MWKAIKRALSKVSVRKTAMRVLNAIGTFFVTISTIFSGAQAGEAPPPEPDTHYEQPPDQPADQTMGEEKAPERNIPYANLTEGLSTHYNSQKEIVKSIDELLAEYDKATVAVEKQAEELLKADNTLRGNPSDVVAKFAKRKALTDNKRTSKRFQQFLTTWGTSIEGALSADQLSEDPPGFNDIVEHVVALINLAEEVGDTTTMVKNVPGADTLDQVIELVREGGSYAGASSAASMAIRSIRVNTSPPKLR